MGVHLEMSKSEKPNWRNNGKSVLMKKKSEEGRTKGPVNKPSWPGTNKM